MLAHLGPEGDLIVVCWYHADDFLYTCHYVKFGWKEWIATDIPASLMTHMPFPNDWKNQFGLVTNGKFLWMGGDICE